MPDTQTVTFTVQPADADPERIEQISELGALLLFGAVCIYCLRQLGRLFEVHHDKD